MQCADGLSAGKGEGEGEISLGDDASREGMVGRPLPPHCGSAERRGSSLART